MGQVHPWWDSNDISHLYRSFLNEVNWVLQGPSLTTCIFNCSESCRSEGIFPSLRKNHFSVWETQAKPLICFAQSSLPYLNSRKSWSTLSIQQNSKKQQPSCSKAFPVFGGALCLSPGSVQVLLIPSRTVSMAESSALQEHQQKACEQSSGFSTGLCWGCSLYP